MITQPLTPEQIWGVPEEQLPEPEQKDYFEFMSPEEKILFNGEEKKQEIDQAEICTETLKRGDGGL